MSSWKRKIGVVRDARLKDRATLEGTVRRQDYLIEEFQKSLRSSQLQHADTVTFAKQTIRDLNWRRVWVELAAVALLRVLEKHANQLYQEVEGAYTCHPTPSPRLRDVTDSGLVIF